MKKQLLFLFLITVTFGSAQELLTIDLSETNRITITATSGLSAATVSGDTNTGFYFANFYGGGAEGLGEVLLSGNLSTASEASNNVPNLFRSGDTDSGLNVYDYSDETTSNFVINQLAFTGTAQWSLNSGDYAAMLDAPAIGNIYFPADSADDVASATIIGTYSVLFPLSVSDNQVTDFNYYPNPVKDVLNISSRKVIDQIAIYNIIGQVVNTQKLNALNGTVNTASLEVGTYFVKAISQDGTTGTFKLVKK